MTLFQSRSDVLRVKVGLHETVGGLDLISGLAGLYLSLSVLLDPDLWRGAGPLVEM